MGRLFSMINSLQIVAYMALFEQLVIPVLAEIFQQVLVTLATFSYVPTNVINRYIYGLEIEETDVSAIEGEWKSKLALFDYTSDNLVQNMGLNLLICAMYSALVSLHLLSTPNCCCGKKLRSKLANHLYWNGLIRFFMEIYLELVVLSMLNLPRLAWSAGSAMQISSSVLACAFMALSVLVPVILTVL